jgi:hypothetical protein
MAVRAASVTPSLSHRMRKDAFHAFDSGLPHGGSLQIGQLAEFRSLDGLCRRFGRFLENF